MIGSGELIAACECVRYEGAHTDRMSTSVLVAIVIVGVLGAALIVWLAWLTWRGDEEGSQADPWGPFGIVRGVAAWPREMGLVKREREADDD